MSEGLAVERIITGLSFDLPEYKPCSNAVCMLLGFYQRGLPTTPPIFGLLCYMKHIFDDVLMVLFCVFLS